MQHDVLGVNVLSRKPNNPSSILGTHIKVNGESPQGCPFTSTGPIAWNPNYKYNEKILKNISFVSIFYVYLFWI